MYGGAAGGGKTWALLLEAMRHTRNPDYGAVIFRRTSPQITNEGGLWDEAGRLYPLAGGRPKVGELQWVFPAGSVVTFRHLQHESNKYDWQGSQIPLIGFDELTHFTESQFFYMLSRNRSTCGVYPYIRGTTNPDASSWVKRFLAPWLDRKYPDPARSGEIRWFVRVDGKILWARTRAELVERHPGSLPKSCTFVRASVFDNPALLKRDPGYLANLQAQTPVERARLLDGDWDVVNEGLVFPEFGSCVVEVEDWPKTLPAFDGGGIDWGFNNPFAALAGAVVDDVLWLWWLRYGVRTTLTEHSQAMPRGPITWHADPAGADQIAEMRRAGHHVIPCTHKGTDPLKHEIGLVTDRIRTGRLKVRGDLGELIEEAGKYRYEGRAGRNEGPTEKPLDKDNHALAALRYLIVGIDRGKAVRDRSPEPSAEAVEAAKQASAAAARAAHMDVDNEYWWGGD